MDEELKSILDEAHQAGASEAQLQNIIDLYKKKSQVSSPASPGGGVAVPSSVDNSSTPVIPQSLMAPQSGSQQAAGTSSLGQNAADFQQIQTGTIPDQYKAAPETPPKPNDPGYSVNSILGKVDQVFHIVPQLGYGAFSIIHDLNRIGNINPDADAPNIGQKLFGWADDYMKNINANDPLPDTLVGNSISAVADAIPTVGAMAATGGASALETATPYLSKLQILQGAITKAGAPLTQYLATTGAITGYGEGYKASGGNVGQSALGAVKGFNEGAVSGATLELQMAAGGQIGDALFKKAVAAGIVKEGGQLTEQAIKSFIGSPAAFAAGSVASDLTNGKPVDWKNAGVSAVTALPFEIPNLHEAYNVKKENDQNNKDNQTDDFLDNAVQNTPIDSKINQAIQIRDNNAIINFSNAAPGDLISAMQNPASSQDLQLQAIQKGIEAQNATDYKDKNTLHLQQVELQNQADIKRLGETVINHGVDGFVQAVNHTGLPEDLKTDLLNKANAINKVFNPVEVQKSDLGKSVSDLNDQIQQVHKDTFTGGVPSTDALVKLNDLIGQRVKAQSDLFQLSYGDAEQQKKGVAIANGVAAEPVTVPPPFVPPTGAVKIDNSNFTGPHYLTGLNEDGGAEITYPDGKTNTVHKSGLGFMGITDDHIQQFKDANTSNQSEQSRFSDSQNTARQSVLKGQNIAGADLSSYTPELHREISFNDLGEFLPNDSGSGDGNYDLAETKELALGQGNNKGVKLSFDSNGIKGHVNLSKPGLEHTFANGDGEFKSENTKQGVFRNNLKEITISKDAKRLQSKDLRYGRLLSRLVDENGWSKTENKDGSVTYKKPVSESKSVEESENTSSSTPVGPAKEISTEPQEGETEFEHKLRTTTDPNELAKMYDDKIHSLQNAFGPDAAIADYNPRISAANFNEHDDRNNVTPAIARNYFTKKGERSIGIDVQAQEINNKYFNGSETVQPADITDFMVRHPGGNATYFTPQGNEDLSAINDRYKELTGKNLRKDIARQLANKYNISNSDAHADAEAINSPHTSELLENNIDNLVHNEGIYTGLPDFDAIEAEFDKYAKSPNEFNIWDAVFDGKKPTEQDIELTKNIIDERRRTQGSVEGAVKEPTAGSEGGQEESTSQIDNKSGTTRSTTEPERVGKEYDEKIAELDDKIAKADKALKNAEKSINDANDLFASSGSSDDGKKENALFKESADVSEENTKRILKPLADRLDKLKSDREDLFNEKDKAVEQAGKQTQFDTEAGSQGEADEPIEPAIAEKVKSAMTNLFPNIKTQYYDSVEAFNKAAQGTSLEKSINDGGIVHAFVDKNRVIHFNPEYMTKDTQLHEQGHILTNWAYHYAPELYKRMMQAGARLGDVHEELRNNGYDLRGNPLFEEAFVTALGREGASRLEEISKKPIERSQLRRLIHEAWTKFERWIAGKTGYSLSKFKNLQDMTFEEFSKYVNDKYLLSDVKISDIKSEDLKNKNTDAFGDAAQMSDKPPRKFGESAAEYAKRVADWMDEQDRKKNEDDLTPPDKVTGSTNSTQVLGDDWTLPDETRGDKIIRAGQDFMKRAKVAQEAIKDAGGTIDKDADYYNHQRRVTALAEHQIKLAHEDIFKSPDKKNPSLFEKMATEKISQTDLGLYLYAKHAEERNRENGITRQLAYNAEHERVSKRLQEARDNGNKSNETYFKNKLDILDKNQSEKYPLMPDGGSGMSNQQSRDIIEDFEKKGMIPKLEDLAKDFKEKVTDKQLKYDLESGRISQDDYDNLKAKYENYVPLQVSDYVEAKNTGATLSKLIRVKDAFQRAKGSIAKDFNQRVNPLSYGVVQLERSIIEGEKNKLLNTFYNLVEQNPNEAVWEIIQPKYKVTYKADGSVDKVDNITDQKIKDNSLYGFRDGRPFYLHIKDDKLRRAVKKEGMAPSFAPINAMTNFLRNGLTVYNPAFWVPNFVKDNFSASFNLNAQDKKGMVAAFQKSIPSAMNGVIKYWKGNRDHPDAKIFQRYLESGAELTYSRSELDLDKLQNISDYFKKNEKSSLNPTVWVPKIGEYMNHASELFELTTRVAAFKAAIDKGIPDHEAAIISKEATVDFSQKGEWSPVTNSLYLFSNAGVQGAGTFFKNIVKAPKAAGTIIGGAIAAGILSAAFNSQTNGTPNPNGSDDKTDYYRINDNEKQGNLIIRNVFGHGFFKIPLGHELGVFPYIGDKLYNYATGHGNGAETAADIASYMASAYSPVGGGSTAQTLAPTVLDPFVQLGENKNAFGTDIYKKVDANSIVPQSQSHFSTTDPVYVAISDKLHKFTGGTGAKAGLIEIPPDIIPWAINTAIGGAGKTATQTVDAVANSLRLTPTEIKNIPVLYRFYTQGNDKNYRSNVISILDKSAQNNVSAMDQTKFYQEAMKAVLKGQIDDAAYEKYVNTFETNMMRVKLSEQFPNATPDELKAMMK